MNRRVIIAAVVVLAALGIGVARSINHQPATPDGSAPQPVVTVAPSDLPAPSSSTGPAASTPSEPVDEGGDGGDDDGNLGPGRDTGPDGQTADPAQIQAQWRPVATGFAQAFTTVHRGDSTTSWRHRLSPYVTAAVDQQLGTVDVSNVPSGQFSGLDVLQSSDEQISVQASYDPGWALVLYLVPDGNNHWKVSGYDRLEQ